MADDEFGRVPAGWYPDPLGLPQLRWWDNHAWTEHVSDARQPMVPTETAYADDDLPRRRDRRTAESADSTPVDSGTNDELPAEQPSAQVLRQLAPPVADAKVTDADAAAAAAAAAREAAEAAVRQAAEEAARAAAREQAAREAAEAAAREEAERARTIAEARAEQDRLEEARREQERFDAARAEAARLTAERQASERRDADARAAAATAAATRPAESIGTPGADNAPPQASRPASNASDAFAAAAFSDPNARSATAATGAGTTSPAASPWVPVNRDDMTAEPRSARSSVNSASNQASVASAASFTGMPSATAPGSWAAQNVAGSTPRPSAPGFGSAPGYGSAPGFGSAPGYGSVPGYGSASAPGFGSAPGAPGYAQAASDAPVSAGRRGAVAAGAPASVAGLHTVEAWAIALLPMLQLLFSLLVVSAFATGPSLALMAGIWVGPLPIVVGLALLDARRLGRLGLDRPASGWWALAGPIVYLIVRAVRISRISGVGFGPVAVWLLLTGLMGASILAVPGLVIASFPGVFAEQANQTIAQTSRSIGANLTATCPAAPPLFIGQQLRCPATNTSGEAFIVTVSLQRANGWIAWQVDDWGVFGLTR